MGRGWLWVCSGHPRGSRGQSVHVFPVGSGIPERFQHPCLAVSLKGFGEQVPSSAGEAAQKVVAEKCERVYVSCLWIHAAQELTKWEEEIRLES